jgi:glycosyltransferase involved in cell wall biosynthesis
MISARYKPSIGGVERHIEGIASKLTDKGIRVTVLTTSHEMGLPRAESNQEADVIRVPFRWEMNPFLVCLWMIANRRKFRQYDIMHAHDIMPLLWCISLKMVYPSKPLYVTFHGYEKDPVPMRFKILRRIAVKFVRACLCIGQFIHELYGTKCDEDSLGAVDSNHWVPQPRKGLVFVGRIEPDTGISYYVQALDILKTEYGIAVELKVCGSGSLRNDLAELASARGLQVTFLGPVSKPMGIVNGCSICLAAGYLSILEAMSLGLPVVGVAKTPLRSHYLGAVLKEGGPISMQRTPQGLAREIAVLMQNPELYLRVSNACVAFAASMTWDNLVIKYLRLWRR